MATLSVRAADTSIEKIAQLPGCARAFEWLDKNASWVTQQQVRLTEVSAPEFAEAPRGDVLKKIFESSGLKVRVDKTGNVVAELRGSEPKSVILVVAHLDTVFPMGTDVHVKRSGDRLEGPGISDNGAGLAALVGVARALTESRLRTRKTIVFSGDVGEEGEGNLRGIRALLDSYRSRLAAVIALDGASTEYITTQGVASRRFEISVTGPGGHSWSDFGAPNPIAALARGIVKFSSIRLSSSARSSFNFGTFEGGTSVNAIPARATAKVDLRSEQEAELDRMEAALRDAIQSGVKEENDAAQSSKDSLQIAFRLMGSRPAGKLPDDSPLLETIRNVDRYLGIHSRTERSSTDANLPLSLGIPAISLGGGGRGGGSHTLAEWYESEGRELGMKRILLTILALAGVQS